ncbi:MAG TPA: NYN domain-containing protein [Casimicrobiaceae bacterium]|nr:NYN domain-containing protein [Casimicrobiaceae bacterium]
MARSPEVTNMALFCDFENVALGVQDAKYDKFDIGKVLERLLLKGSIVVKKAYCDWERYKSFKAPMHEASFEMIEIPHVRQSGKNSADIRMVVDALDLCYTKAHVDTFVIISGDSDFSPLVSKLRENDKTVIGVGVKNSTSDLLIANCDEFIYYDDLVREKRKAAVRKGTARAPAGPPKAAVKAEAHAAPSGKADDERRHEALELIVGTVEALVSERGDEEKVWGSMVKQALKRRKPGFNESYYGFRSFNGMLEEAERSGSLELERDEKSGGYLVRLPANGD